MAPFPQPTNRDAVVAQRPRHLEPPRARGSGKDGTGGLAGDRPERLAVEEDGERLGVDGPRKEEALAFVAAGFEERADLLRALDPLGDQVQPDQETELDDAAHELQAVW
jgi:hypothetical protein